MKVQFFGGNTFVIEGENATVVLDPSGDYKGDSVDIVTNSGGADYANIKEYKKVLELPGEFEISEVLVMGYYATPENVVYRMILDEVAFVHFGTLTEVPGSKFFDKLGENIDIIFVCLSEQFDDKKAKNLIEQVDPRMVFLGGDESYFPKLVESMGAKTAEENPVNIAKSQLSDDKTEVVILVV